jgi:hypothetical protein
MIYTWQNACEDTPQQFTWPTPGRKACLETKHCRSYDQHLIGSIFKNKLKEPISASLELPLFSWELQYYILAKNFDTFSKVINQRLLFETKKINLTD